MGSSNRFNGGDLVHGRDSTGNGAVRQIGVAVRTSPANVKVMVRPIRENELAALLRLYALFHPEEKGADPDGAATQELWRAILANPNLR